MFKKGFTLAEVLITLGIIGVVAALTLPGLLTDTASAQIGPKLAKARSMFEQGNQALLSGNNVDRLSEGGFLQDHEAYLKSLSDYMKINKFDTYFETVNKLYEGLNEPYKGEFPTYLSSDGMVYIVTTKDWGYGNANKPAHKNAVGVVWVDINGTTGPNFLSADVFCFQLMERNHVHLQL